MKTVWSHAHTQVQNPSRARGIASLSHMPLHGYQGSASIQVCSMASVFSCMM